MTGKKEILEALMREIKGCIPQAECYIGKLLEGYTPPAFLLRTIYQGESRHNLFFRARDLEVQLLYFGRTDGYGTMDSEEKRLAEEKLVAFLDTFLLQVGERKLTFSYETKEVDEVLTFILRFRYLEDAPMAHWQKEADREMAGSVAFREEVR